MATKIKSRGRIEGGKLIIYSRAILNAEVTRQKDCEVVVTIERIGKRSSQANRYLWGVVNPLICERLRDLGHDIDLELTHEFLKQKFNPQYVRDEDAEVIGTFGGSTATMDTATFLVYVDTVKRWASSTLGIYIPDPNEQTKLGFDNEA